MHKLGDFELNEIYTGDARQLSDSIPNDSVDAIFTDPVYQNIDDYVWLAQIAERVLKPGGDLLAYFGHYHLTDITQYMSYRWLLVEKKIGSGTLMWSYRLYSHCVPLLWFSKGKPHHGDVSRIDFQWSTPNGKAINHRWGKNRCRVMFWIERFLPKQAIVLDPFCGGGAILAAAATCGRRWIGFELQSETAARAKALVSSVQLPLPQPRVAVQATYLE